ncbi:MAG: pentapeptide repeat-containing protein [Ginsengibacter sp.]
MTNDNNYTDAWVAQRLQFLGLISGTQGDDFRAEDFSGQKLRGKNFSGANLRLANFVKADLREANFSFATLHMADLTRADLRGAKLAGADLLDALLVSAKLEGANFTAARLSDANLSRANLKGTLLGGADLTKSNLEGASLIGTYLHSSDAREANFTNTKILGSNLCWSKFHRAVFRSAKVISSGLVGANLNYCNLSNADFTDSDLIQCSLVGTDLTGCTLNGARVFGASVWNIHGEPREQTGLVVTPSGEAAVTVDDLELAQFIYLILNNGKLRGVIDTITSKAVLILGRFGKRMKIIAEMRTALRRKGYAPIVFDFEVTSSKNLSDTIKLLAQMARFILVDVTDPQSAPYEIGIISMMNLISTPLVPLIEGEQKPFAMLEDILRQNWCTELHRYKHPEHLATIFETDILTSAEAKRRHLLGLK